MSKTFEICSATYNIVLNQDEDDVFRTGCAHLYHFLQGNCNNGRSGVYKPMMLKMHLELNELIEETEEQIAEPNNSNNPERQFIQQPEAKVQSLEDSLQANIADAVNKVTEHMDGMFEKNLSNNIVNKTPDVGNNTIDHMTNKAFLKISNNFPRQSDKQLEEKLKALEEALQVKNDVVNKLIERMEKLEKNLSNNIVTKETDVGINTIDNETNNALLSSSDNDLRLSALQLEVKLKTLEDALQASNADGVNKLKERMEKLEKNLSNIIDNKLADVGKNTFDHESNNVLLKLSENDPIESTIHLEAKLKTLEDSLRLETKLENIVHKATDIDNNTTAHERNNALLCSSDNAARQSAQQLEAKLKTLEDSLQANNVDAENKLIERMEKLERNFTNNFGNKATDVGNNTIENEINSTLLSSCDNAMRQSAQQFEEKLKTLEDTLQAKYDIVNEIMERIEKLEKNLSNNLVTIGKNTIDHETNNALLNSSDNAERQSVQQLYKEVKAFKDRIEELASNKADNETADIGNPTTHDNSTEKQQHQTSKHNSSPEPLNNGNSGSDDHSDGKEYQMTPEEKQEIEFDKDNLIQIWYINSSDSSLETAVHNVIKLAKEMDLSLTSDQIKHIDVRRIVQDSLRYYVFFRTKTIKEAFLMKSYILERSPHYLAILNESEYSGVYIRNFNSADLSKDSAIVNVIGLAKQMGLTLMRDQITGIAVFTVNQTCIVCYVEFSTAQVKDEFLKKRHILKELPETNSVDIF